MNYITGFVHKDKKGNNIMNYKCKKCGAVFSSPQGFAMHRMRKHNNDRSVQSVATTRQAKPKMAVAAKRKYTRRIPIIETGVQTIDIPVILRIPITVGKAQFIEFKG